MRQCLRMFLEPKMVMKSSSRGVYDAAIFLANSLDCHASLKLAMTDV